MIAMARCVSYCITLFARFKCFDVKIVIHTVYAHIFSY